MGRVELRPRLGRKEAGELTRIDMALVGPGVGCRVEDGDLAVDDRGKIEIVREDPTVGILVGEFEGVRDFLEGERLGGRSWAREHDAEQAQGTAPNDLTRPSVA